MVCQGRVLICIYQETERPKKKGYGDIMKQKKQIVGDACVVLISLASVVIFLGEIFNWMLYV